MFNKSIAPAAVAGLLSIPFAATAFAEPDTDDRGVFGPGGVNTVYGVTLGEVVRGIAAAPGSVPDVVSVVSGGHFKAPGEGVKNVTPGSGNGVGPSPEE